MTQRALLAEHGVVGPQVAQSLDDQTLRLAIDLTHEIGGRGLRLDAKGAPQPCDVHLTGVSGELGREAEELLKKERGWGPGALRGGPA